MFTGVYAIIWASDSGLQTVFICCAVVVSRKNKFPVGDVMIMKLFVPLLETPLLVDQLEVVKSEFCCNVQPVEGYGHDTITLLPERVMVNIGGVMLVGLWTMTVKLFVTLNCGLI